MEEARSEENRLVENGGDPEEVTCAAEGDEAVAEWKWSLENKVGYIFTGVIAPVVCFVFAGLQPTMFGVHWQSGELADYCELLFALESCLPFYPFLLYSMACMTCVVIRPRRFSQLFLIRLGIYTGVVLALQYFILLGIATGGLCLIISPIGALIVGCIAWFVLSIFLTCWHAWATTKLRRIVTIAALILVGALCWPVCIGILLACSTSWAVIAYSLMSWRLLRRNGRARWQFSLAQLLGFVTWLAVYCSAWRMSVMLMLGEYAKLPTTPPDDCYVCTTAARGHRWLVGARAVRTETGNVFGINDQTRYLKAAEIVLVATWPRGHRLARAVYDCVGPAAAKLLAHPLAADAGYLAMKPAEWTARAFFVVALPGASRLARRLYRGG